IVTLDLLVRGGGSSAAQGKEGLASIMAALLTEGTKTRDTMQLAGALSMIGASIDAESDRESTTLSVTTLTQHTAKALELYNDVLRNPAFPEKEMRRLQLEREAEIRARLDSAQGIAGVVFPRLLYSLAHPYGRPDVGTLKSIQSLTRDDVVSFHK